MICGTRIIGWCIAGLENGGLRFGGVAVAPPDTLPQQVPAVVGSLLSAAAIVHAARRAGRSSCLGTV